MDRAEMQLAARHVLGYHHLEDGWTPGSFTEGLIALWTRADVDNRAKLALVYPEMSAVIGYFTAGDVEHVRRIARGEA